MSQARPHSRSRSPSHTDRRRTYKKPRLPGVLGMASTQHAARATNTHRERQFKITPAEGHAAHRKSKVTYFFSSIHSL